MILATNNKNKIEEIKNIFLDNKIYSLKEKNIICDIQEDGKTFEENAKKKAIEIYKIAQEPTIADDSGLCIDALNGFPGIKTNRFLGNNSTDEEKNIELLKLMKDKSDRNCSFVCVMVYYDGKEYIIGKGELRGKIVEIPRGKNGFGFDEIFELDNGKTLAELTEKEKNTISARYLAIIDLKNKIKEIRR